jgi:hypothetical protein
MNTYGGAKVWLHLVLISAVDVNVRLCSTAALPTGKELPYTLNRRVARPYSRFEHSEL